MHPARFAARSECASLDLTLSCPRHRLRRSEPQIGGRRAACSSDRLLDWLIWPPLSKTAGLIQQTLGDRLGKPQSFVAKYENGERRLDVSKFVVIAEALDADTAEILGEMKRAVGS